MVVVLWPGVDSYTRLFLGRPARARKVRDTGYLVLSVYLEEIWLTAGCSLGVFQVKYKRQRTPGTGGVPGTSPDTIIKHHNIRVHRTCTLV